MSSILGLLTDWEDKQATQGTWVIVMETDAYGRSPEHPAAIALAEPPSSLLGMT